jgi:8-oxo-dGTP pyrophosphatase MutT (NUDIX family)
VALTKQQALTLGLLYLAGNPAAAALPGATIAQQAAATTEAAQDAAQKAAGLQGQHGPPKKVASALGEAFYKAPIGSLIIPHPQHAPSEAHGGTAHYVKGAPSHFIYDTSEAKWVANQWKDPDKADKDAHQAVEAGTHKWVQSGNHEFAVHKDLDVHVPNSTDVHNPAAVKAAPKVIVKKDQDGKPAEHVLFHSDHPADSSALPTAKTAQEILAQHWKKLDEAPPQKSVSFNGKHAAWVPADWKVYKAVNADDKNLHGKWAKDPQGAWHLVLHSGEVVKEPAEQHQDAWLKAGAIVPDDDQAEQHAPLPVPGESQPGKLKAEVAAKEGPPLAVTKDEIQHALKILQDDKSTAVKQPLAKAGHALAAMDYHQVAQQELSKHPELKVAPGTKKEHVGQVKSAVIHHLAGRAAHLAHTEAEQDALQAAQDKVQAEAEHAQLLTPHTFELGGVTATAEQVQDAVDALTAAKSTAIKQVLKAKGNPLAESDYWAVIHAYEDQHPDTEHLPQQKGTKQQHFGYAKTVFIAALTEKAGLLAKADDATGHTEAAELYDLAKNGNIKKSWYSTAYGAMAKAAQNAADFGQDYYTTPVAGQFGVQPVAPDGVPYYKVTPQLKATYHDMFGGEPTSADTLLWNAVHIWLEPQGGTEAAQDKSQAAAEQAPEPSAAARLPDWATAAQWKKNPQWKEIDEKLTDLQPTDLYNPHEATTLAQHLARLLVYTSALDTKQYLYKNDAGSWETTTSKPTEGTLGAPGELFYEVTPDHRVLMHAPGGTLFPREPESVLLYLKQGVKPAEEPPAAPEPEAPGLGPGGSPVPIPADEPSYKPAESPVPALKGGVLVGEFPPGSVVYEKTGPYGGAYARDPSGQWWYIQSYSGNTQVKKAPSYYVSDKDLNGSSLTPKEPPSVEEAAHGKEVADALKTVSFGAMTAGQAISEHGSEKLFPTWLLAAAYKLAEKGSQGSDTEYISHEYGNWHGGYLQSSTDEYYKVNPLTLEVSYHPQGGDLAAPSPELQDQLLQAVKANVVPAAVNVDGKLFGAGYWKNPKGKSYLHVQPVKVGGYNSDFWKYGTKAWGKYIYFATDGSSKELTPAAAAKQLEKATQYSSVPFPQAGQPPDQVAYATVLAPASDLKLWSGAGKAPETAGELVVFSDGSAQWKSNDGAAPNVVPDYTVDALMQSGTVLDKYGTTVVEPGTKPTGYHIWGSDIKTRDEIQALLDTLNNSPGLQFVPEFQKFLAGDDFVKWNSYKGFGKQFMADHQGDTGDKQKAAVTGLLTELLAVPGLPEGAEVSKVEPGAVPAKAAKAEKSEGPVFLKTMPEGVTSAKDIFTFTPQGWAQPYTGFLPDSGMLGTKTETIAKIKDISQQFGKGQVVGTHLSSLSAYDLLLWAKAWKAGDMKAVFELDAKGGKVSPAHPGAPDNTETHQVTWSPLDPHQVPASQDIPGTWSSAGLANLPAAEVANYLIKMGFQHAEHLYPYEREMVVKAHRGHDQAAVDQLTGTANDRFGQGQSPKTEPPVWTDGLQPANAYDAYVQASTPADEWSETAVQAFADDHEAEVTPYLQQLADEMGNTLAYVLDYTFYKKQAIQKWLDNEHVKAVAEQSVPVWKKIPTGDMPSHGHEVWKATRTIPYTGETSTWYVKPAPPSSSAGGGLFRLEQEHAANRLGKLFGFRTAESQLLTDPAFGGSPVQAQKAIPGEPLGYYTDLPPWSAFTPAQVADIASEHLLDWVLSNDDSSANNMIKTPDGHIAGIDKGRAWGNMDWPGLAGTSAMDTMTQLVYTRLYDGIRNHQVTKDAADQAFLQVIQQARKIQNVSDASVQNILEQGFAHRTKFGSLGSRQALIDEVLRRKNSLADDFTKLWAQVYQDAGYAGASSDFGKSSPWGDAPGHNPRYGLVVFNDQGQVQLREVKNHYNSTAWSFSKGGADPGETSLQAAVRETAEEMGARYQPVGYVPGAFTGTQSTSYFYLAKAEGAVATPELDNGETEQTKWVALEEAKQLLAQSESKTVAARDQAILDAALKAWQALPPDKPVLKQGSVTGLPEVPVQRLPDAHGAPLHSGFSEPGLLDHVAAAKSHGVPAFFGGPELRDMHVLLWQQNDGQGAKVTHGETFLKGTAYDKVIGWLKSHSGKDAAPADDTTVSYPADSYGPGKAPYDSPDRGGLAGEKNYYNTIITAARSVTMHKTDGQYNQGKLDAMAEVQQKLQLVQQAAEAVVGAHPDSTDPGVQQSRNLLDMAQTYLSHIAAVLDAKAGSFGFGEGDLPRWLPKSTPKPEVKDELSALGIKLQAGTASKHDKGSIDETTGEFNPGSYTSAHQDPGKFWRMTLPDGEQIEFGDGQDTGVKVSHWGRVRFTSKDGSAASLERVRAALQLAGLDMREAEVPDFELFYWRHLLSVMNDRADSKDQPVWKVLQERLGTAYPVVGGAKPGKNEHRKIIAALETLGKADPQAEVRAYRDAFATLTSPAQVADWAERGGFFPRQKHFDPTAPAVVGGKPDWYRFDLAAKVKSLPMPIRQSSSGSAASYIVKAGGSYGKDALIRVAGTEAGGLGNPYESGGPGYVFTRLNVTDNRAAVFSPLTLARTRNYSYDNDYFGNQIPYSEGGYSAEGVYRRKDAHWNPDVWRKYSGGSNETMISDALSLLDDVELVQSSYAEDRAELIAYLKNHGITEIRYLPVEDRIVQHIGKASVDKVKANLAAHPELLDPLAESQVYTGATEPSAQAAESGQAAAQQAAQETGAAPPTVSELLGQITDLNWVKGGGEAYPTWKNGDLQVEKATYGGYMTYDGTEYLGTFDTLQEAKDAAVSGGEGPPF